MSNTMIGTIINAVLEGSQNAIVKAVKLNSNDAGQLLKEYSEKYGKAETLADVKLTVRNQLIGMEKPKDFRVKFIEKTTGSIEVLS